MLSATRFASSFLKARICQRSCSTLLNKENPITFKWKRPATIEYPKVWHSFKARDLNSDNLVEYRIEDLTESRTQDAFAHIKKNFIADEPIGSVLRLENDVLYYEDYVRALEAMIKQKTPLVCYKAGSDEIVGLNMNFVKGKDDHFDEQYAKTLKSQGMKNVFALFELLYKNYNPFEYFGVDYYMDSFGLTVDKKYRGRNIGQHFLATRKVQTEAYGLKFTQGIFSSDFSNRNADQAGFVPKVVINYADLVESVPEFAWLKDIESKQITLKTSIM